MFPLSLQHQPPETFSTLLEHQSKKEKPWQSYVECFPSPINALPQVPTLATMVALREREALMKSFVMPEETGGYSKAEICLDVTRYDGRGCVVSDKGRNPELGIG